MLDLRHARDQGSSRLSPPARQCREVRGAARQPRQVHLQGRQRPRPADGGRGDAGAVEELVAGARFQPALARHSRGQRPLSHRSGRSRPLDHLRARQGLLGAGSAGQQGPQQFRHDPVRLLSRHVGDARSVQGRADRRARGIHVEGLGDGYDFPAVQDGAVIKAEFHHQVPQGMQGFVFNTRRPIFADRRVREALGYLFDFEWTNKNLFYGAYTRTRSYFDNSDLAATGLPQGDELQAPRSLSRPDPGRGLHHANTRRRNTTAAAISATTCGKRSSSLKEAGWSIKGEKLVNDKTGEPFDLRVPDRRAAFRADHPAVPENLERIGIYADLRNVDPAQYENRMARFRLRHDVAAALPRRSSPGNEQRDFWGQQGRPTEHGSANVVGIKSNRWSDRSDPKSDRGDNRARRFVPIVHALDRVLLFGYYVVAELVRRTIIASPIGTSSACPKTHPKYAYIPLAAVDQSWWARQGRRARRLSARAGGQAPQGSALGADARLHRSPPRADHPDAVRDHAGQLRHRAGGAGRPGRCSSSRKLQGAQAAARSARISGGGDAATTGARRDARARRAASIPKLHQPARHSSTASTSRRPSASSSMIGNYLTLRFRQQLLPRPAGHQPHRATSCRCRSRSGLWTTLLTYLISIPLGIRKAVRDGIELRCLDERRHHRRLCHPELPVRHPADRAVRRRQLLPTGFRCAGSSPTIGRASRGRTASSIISGTSRCR